MSLSITRSATVVLAIGAAILALAACGGDEDDDGDGGSAATSADSAALSVQSIDGTDVLVDSAGRALYTSTPEEDGSIQCTGECTSDWDPAIATGDSLPDDLGGEVGTVKRPEGDEQLTFEGVPLYSFTDEEPGELTGDGFVDDFEGTTFEWHAATTSSAPSPDDSGSESSGGEAPSGGGY